VSVNAYLVNAGWRSYKRHVLHPDAGPRQIRETKKAFYAGAVLLLENILLSLDPGTEPTDADMKRLSDVQAELEEFAFELIAAQSRGGVTH